MSISKTFLNPFLVLCGSAALNFAVAAPQGIAPINEDFETLDPMNPSAMTDAGWLVFANVFAPGGAYLYGYGPFPAPNGGPAFCAVAPDQGGPDQGTRQVVAYSDYNNGDHANGNTIESSVFREQVVGAGDVGKTFTYQFDAKAGDIAGSSSALAFIKIIDSTTFSMDGYASVDTGVLPTSWGTYSMSITIDANHVGDFFQIGFQTSATNYEPSGVFYDNVSLTENVQGLASINEDFETLDPNNPSAMTDAGWLVFANVFAPGGAYLYGYGPFPAPNGGPAFCAVAPDQGGPDQGTRQVVAYSDYSNGDHANGNIIESSVFLEQVVTAGDVGKTFTYQFDAKAGNIAGSSSALAFIKIIDFVTFSQDGYASVETGTLPTTWGTYSMSITIDANHVGDFFQIGFQTSATNYEPSGVFYDNVSLTENTGIGAAYCAATANSSGAAAQISASGSTSVAANDLVLSAGPVPANQFGVFYYGNIQRQTSFGNGISCIASSGTIVRLPVQSTGAGTLTTAVDNTPLAGTITAGSTWNFQAWFRDPAAGGAFYNLSNGLNLTFQP